MSFQVDNGTQMEEGSSGLGNLAQGTEQFFKDPNMPDGDACRPDGTLKEASEMYFPNSPSEAPGNLHEVNKDNLDDYFFLNLKKGLPEQVRGQRKGKESTNKRARISDTEFEVEESNDGGESMGEKSESSSASDSDDSGPRSKEQRKVSIPTTPQIIRYLPLVRCLLEYNKQGKRTRRQASTTPEEGERACEQGERVCEQGERVCEQTSMNI